MKKQKIYLLLDSKRYHWKIGTTARAMLIRLSEIISIKKRKHSIIGYIEINASSKTLAECVAKSIQADFELLQNSTVIGNDYIIKKDNIENIKNSFIQYSKDICDHKKVEYKWYEC